MKNEKHPKQMPSAFPLDGFDTGMTLRDYFANSAMQGHLASYYGAGVHCDLENMSYLAKSFYDMADAMLKQREL
jgi:hypothetical protein